MNDSQQDGEIHWPGMTLHRRDRDTDRAGGVLMYIKDSLAMYTSVIDQYSFVDDDIEIITVQICKPKTKQKIVASIYRPPGGDKAAFARHLENLIDNIDLTNNIVWIGGDYNIQFNKKNDPHTEKMHQIAIANNMRLLIDTCTRPEGGTTIDNIMTNAVDLVFESVVPILTSDHLPVVSVQKKVREPDTVYEFYGRSYRCYVKDDLEEILLYHDWSEFYKFTDPNVQWAYFVNIL